MCGSDTRTGRSQLVDSIHPASADLPWKKQVAEAFDNAARTYDDHAEVQRLTAELLSAQIADRIYPGQVSTALEIGCGTGFLTRPLLDAFSGSSWTITDISQQMIARCQNHLGLEKELASNVEFIVADGEFFHEHAFSTPCFDLICSNLTFQWYEDLPTALDRMMSHINPGGWLYFTTLASDNFSGIAKQFPFLKQTLNQHYRADEIGSVLESLDCGHVELTNFPFEVLHEDLRGFLGSLKSIGAAVSREPAEMNRSELRLALSRSRQNSTPVIADYHVLMVAAQKRANG